jgi:hypothetical protein
MRPIVADRLYRPWPDDAARRIKQVIVTLYFCPNLGLTGTKKHFRSPCYKGNYQGTGSIPVEIPYWMVDC